MVIFLLEMGQNQEPSLSNTSFEANAYKSLYNMYLNFSRIIDDNFDPILKKLHFVHISYDKKKRVLN